MRGVLLFLLIFNISCSNKDKEIYAQTTIQPEDIQEDATDIEEDTYSIWEDPCVECDWYFCENLDAVWQKQICINECNNPRTIVYESECEEKLECNPTQYLVEKDAPCVDDDGKPGIQDKVCNKGIIQYTDCVATCSEEVCDGLDNDCDGEIDEGELNACGLCGLTPPEVCDGIDNDCDGLTDEELVQACSTACEEDLSYCIDGEWFCTAKEPFNEVCDGLDNDCDGEIDEGIECFCSEKDVGVLVPCAESPLICGEGYKTCECEDETCNSFKMTECLASCHWFPDLVEEGEVCDPYLGKIVDEECNNHDDNCNQLVDEDLLSLCYSADPQTMGIGICQPGYLYCKEGVWGNDFTPGTFVPDLCLGEVTPMQEDICNGEDTNCDGITEKELEPTDILFIIDMSGSMSSDVNAVLSALSQFALYYSDSEVIKWGLVLIAVEEYDPEYTKNIEKLKIEINLTDFQNFMASFSNINTNNMNGGDEQSLDAIYLSLQNLIGGGTFDIPSAAWISGWGGINKSVPEKENWNIDWRSDAKRVVVVFTDEEPQSYLMPKIKHSDVISAIEAAPELSFYVFTSGFTSVFWESLVDATTKSTLSQLTTSAEEMYGNLLSILDETACNKN